MTAVERSSMDDTEEREVVEQCEGCEIPLYSDDEEWHYDVEMVLLCPACWADAPLATVDA